MYEAILEQAPAEQAEQHTVGALVTGLQVLGIS